MSSGARIKLSGIELGSNSLNSYEERENFENDPARILSALNFATAGLRVRIKKAIEISSNAGIGIESGAESGIGARLIYIKKGTNIFYDNADKAADEKLSTSESGRSPPSKDTRNPRGVASVLPASCKPVLALVDCHFLMPGTRPTLPPGMRMRNDTCTPVYRTPSGTAGSNYARLSAARLNFEGRPTERDYIQPRMPVCARKKPNGTQPNGAERRTRRSAQLK
ncbi:hypothetical protein EVAR_356_1 [Eumeta japonica]|uniref:Uncharacterized protein n=1 Tax=Eumeta variegata TaxID=151549 RepID=A0A4C1SA12_EUMVA|nr:hypothetical protein EVAR_356_1 [Eumeta japonica]